ncbi:Nsp1-like C-terminal region-domain-containing protein [Syncephalis fuscata]|nr:Nsp1-like C-terminal region-domain-containing protein [Syncephalis fuscata]
MGGGLFGAKTAAATTAAPASSAPSGNLFGASPATGGLFGAKTNAAAPAPSALSGGLFGAKPPAAAAATPAATSAAGGLFGGAAAPATPTPPAAGGLFGNKTAATGGGLFGNTPASSAASPAAAATTSAAPPKFGFGAPAATTQANTSLPTAPTSTPSLFGGFGGASTAATTTTATALGSTTTANIASLGTTKPSETSLAASLPSTAAPVLTAAPVVSSTTAATAATTATTTASTSAAAAGESNRLKGRSLENIVSLWASELDQHTREFHRRAQQVSDWDRILIENGNQISKLVNETTRLESAQSEVERQLEYIETQQRDLSHVLDVYEDRVTTTLSETTNNTERRVADTERARAYDMASSLNHQLDDMSRALTAVIEEVNRVGGEGGQATADDPLMQVVQILDAHLTSLEWVDRNASELSVRVDALNKLQSSISTDFDRGASLHK